MILLDTNVYSALMRLHQEPIVATWVTRQVRTQLFLCTPVIFEIRYGIERLPAGKRRRDLEAVNERLLTRTFREQLVDLDPASAEAAGIIHAQQLARGNNVDVADSMIAGVAKIHGAAVATRDVAGFAGLGLDTIDPWRAI